MLTLAPESSSSCRILARRMLANDDLVVEIKYGCNKVRFMTSLEGEIEKDR